MKTTVLMALLGLHANQAVSIRQASSSHDAPIEEENVATMQEVMAVLDARQDEEDAAHQKEM